MTTFSDQQIITRAMDGDSSAFRMLVQQHQRFVYSVAFRLLSDKNDAEDITQEAFIRLWKNLRAYRTEVKLTTWLYKIVTNLCLDFLKASATRMSRGAIDSEKHQAPGGDHSDSDVIYSELKDILNAAVERLTPKQKAVFVLRDMEGLNVEEVEAILDMSAGNIKSNLYYARLRVAEFVQHYYAERGKEIS
jgi:RNA polymerase sigma-70 factor, ECF subfamily